MRLVCAAWLKTRATGSKQGEALAKPMKLSRTGKDVQVLCELKECPCNIKIRDIFLLLFPGIYRLDQRSALSTGKIFPVKTDPWHCHILSQ